MKNKKYVRLGKITVVTPEKDVYVRRFYDNGCNDQTVILKASKYDRGFASAWRNVELAHLHSYGDGVVINIARTVDTCTTVELDYSQVEYLWLALNEWMRRS